MPATVYAVAGGKGGVGKTTTAANLAATFRATGREVLLVDADLAMSNLQDIVGLDHEPTLHDVLGGGATLEEAIVHESEDVLDTEGRLDILPGSTGLDAFADADPGELPAVVDSLTAAYDTIILDTPSGVTRETAIPLTLADQTLVVTTPDEAAIRDAEKTVRLVEQAEGRIAGLVISGICPGLDEATIVDRVGIEHLATIPDLDVPGVNTLAPYRRLVVRLLIGREIATDPATVLDIDPGETPRITSSLEPIPEVDESPESATDNQSAADSQLTTDSQSATDTDESGCDTAEQPVDADADAEADDASGAGSSSTSIDATDVLEAFEDVPATDAEDGAADSTTYVDGVVEEADDDPDTAETEGTQSDAEDDEEVRVETEESDAKGRIDRFVSAISGPNE